MEQPAKEPATAHWEVKLVGIVAMYAINKAVSSNLVPGSPVFSAIINVARGVFVAGHLYLFWRMRAFNRAIMKRPFWTMETKERARGLIQSDLMQPLFVRALLVVLVHVYFSMMPPLLVSVWMGWLTLLEKQEEIVRGGERREGDNKSDGKRE